MGVLDSSVVELPPTADLHVHLRQDKMMKLVVPSVREGGVDSVFVMPNLQPPITTVAQALEYRSQLQALEPKAHYLMSLYLHISLPYTHRSYKVTDMLFHPSITPTTIAEAAKAGIAGVKLYPQGVTTNSDAGVSDLSAFYPVFAAMEKHDLVLNLHGEVHSHPSSNPVSAEEAFLPQLHELHSRFPKLRIVLEHCSTAAAIEAVRVCGRGVAGTITAHHLYSTVDDTSDPLAFCKPIPKRTSDRDALLKAAISGDGRFFFGSDSAPHPLTSKLNSTSSSHALAGVFTQPFATQLVLLAFDEAVQRGTISHEVVTQERLEQFLSRNGRKFYKLPEPTGKIKIVLEKKGEKIPKSIRSEEDGGEEVGISRWGAEVRSLRWVEV